MIWPNRTPRHGFLKGRAALLHGNGRRRKSLLAALTVLAVAAGLALVATSAGQPPNTWSGTWVNSAPDGSFWVFAESGQSVGGVWKGKASSGTLSGTVQGDNLSGTLVNNEAGQSASFSITLAPDGHSFSGTFTIIGGSTGQWRSACAGGACLSNVAPAPPGPPGGGVPAAPTSPKLLAAAAAWGQLGPGTALEPGGTAVAPSPPIARNQRRASVTVSSDDADEFTNLILLGGVAATIDREGELRHLRGNCVRATASVYKDKIAEDKFDDPDFVKHVEEHGVNALAYAYLFLRACLEWVSEQDNQAHPASVRPNAGNSRVSCKLRSLPLSVRVDNATGTIQYARRKASRHDPMRHLRVSCKRARNGTVTLRIRTASGRIKLRKVLGPRLVVGAFRSTAASDTTNIRTTFKRR